MDDREIRTVPFNQTTQNGRRQLLASPSSVSSHYDTHVQIVAENRSFDKSVVGTPLSIEFSFGYFAGRCIESSSGGKKAGQGILD
jgi:hypothetical protein